MCSFVCLFVYLRRSDQGDSLIKFLARSLLVFFGYKHVFKMCSNSSVTVSLFWWGQRGWGGGGWGWGGGRILSGGHRNDFFPLTFIVHNQKSNGGQWGGGGGGGMV